MKLDHTTGVEDMPTEDWVRGSLPMPRPPQWWIDSVDEFFAEQRRIENLDDYDRPMGVPDDEFSTDAAGYPIFEEPVWWDQDFDIGKEDLYDPDNSEDL